jgi:hypoxanthine phosphoribosyltransferase
VKSPFDRVYSAQQLEKRVVSLGREISQDYGDRALDVVILLENAFVFAADLVRCLPGRVVCHFVRTEIRDLQLGGHDRREIYFSRTPRLHNRDVLVVDAVIQSGVTQDFLLKRLQESRPRSLRLAVLFDRPMERRLDIKPDYFGFRAASKYLAGYGLAGSRGWYRNLPYVGVPKRRAARLARRRAKSPVRRAR